MKLANLFTMLSILSLSLGLLILPSAQGENGITDNEIVIGQSTNVTGKSPKRTIEQARAAKFYFSKINDSGGILGRKIKLISYDDGYDPEKAIANTKKLVENDKAFALFQYYGTPISKSVLPLVAQYDIPFLMPYSGADFLRTPVLKNVFNIKGSYADEMEELVRYTVNVLKITNIGIFYQDDAFGLSGRTAIQKSLAVRGLTLRGEGSYKRNTIDVKSGIESLKRADVKAVIIVGVYESSGLFITSSIKAGFEPKFLIVTNTSNEFLKAVGTAGEGMYLSSDLPLFSDTSFEIIRSYQADMKAANIDLGQSSLLGYVEAAVTCEALKRTGRDLTRGLFRRTLEEMKDTNIGGLKITFSPKDHQGLHLIYMVTIKNGEFAQIPNEAQIK